MFLNAVQKSKNHCGANDLSVTVINTQVYSKIKKPPPVALGW
jgi:hypothetical protein